MKPNRKADLQRKLTLAPIPKPPSGLAERIKREIPKDLRFNVEEERQRLSHWIGLSLRVAASILVVISGTFLALHLLTRMESEKPGAASTAAKRQLPAEPQRQKPAVGEPLTTAQAEKNRKAIAARSVMVAQARPGRTREEAAAPAPPPAAPPPPAAMAPVATAQEQAPMRDEARRETMAMSAKAAALPKSLPTNSATVDALVQQFGAVEAAARDQVRLQVEATASPIDAKPMLRVTLAQGDGVSDVHLAVTGARAVVVHGTNGTSLYELEKESVATIGVRFRADGNEQSTERTIQRADIVPWSAASRPTKAAVLAAAWGEALRSGGDVTRIAAAAREAGLTDLADRIERKER